ncbi:MAG: LysR family transcriptional regulator [Lautropia sp.]|nr:LysR family transcriptional regulator [Lautropia sp.]
MDLRQIRYFIAVAETRNFTRAAERLHIAQPPLSRQIQLLEEELGAQLILRDSRPLRLTEAGRVFYEQAIQLLYRVEQLKRTTVQVALGHKQTLSIGFVASTLYGGLPGLVRKLRQHHPEVDIQLVELSSIQQISALKSGRIDVGFGRMHSNDQSVSRIILREEKLVLAIPPAFELAQGKGPIALTDISNQRLIVFPKETRPGFADHILGLLNEHDVFPTQVQEVKELQTALGLVAAEAGICIIPSAARIRSDLCYRPIQDERATSPIILSHRLNDDSWYIPTIKTLISEMYAENPPWLDAEHNALTTSSI